MACQLKEKATNALWMALYFPNLERLQEIDHNKDTPVPSGFPSKTNIFHLFICIYCLIITAKVSSNTLSYSSTLAIKYSN